MWQDFFASLRARYLMGTHAEQAGGCGKLFSAGAVVFAFPPPLVCRPLLATGWHGARAQTADMARFRLKVAGLASMAGRIAGRTDNGCAGGWHGLAWAGTGRNRSREGTAGRRTLPARRPAPLRSPCSLRRNLMPCVFPHSAPQGAPARSVRGGCMEVPHRAPRR